MANPVSPIVSVIGAALGLALYFFATDDEKPKRKSDAEPAKPKRAAEKETASEQQIAPELKEEKPKENEPPKAPESGA